jgi:hypothetical protein
MAKVGSVSAKFVAGMLRDPGGLPFSVLEMAQQHHIDGSAFGSLEILARNASVELSERAQSIRYPVIYVYCDRVINKLREKFRTFSGTADLVAEVRVTHDRIEQLEAALHICVDAVTDVLDRNRGQWNQNMFYAGGYEVHFGGIKPGGRNFIQSAKVKFQVNFSTD